MQIATRRHTVVIDPDFPPDSMVSKDIFLNAVYIHHGAGEYQTLHIHIVADLSSHVRRSCTYLSSYLTTGAIFTSYRNISWRVYIVVWTFCVVLKDWRSKDGKVTKCADARLSVGSDRRPCWLLGGTSYLQMVQPCNSPKELGPQRSRRSALWIATSSKWLGV